MTIRINRTHLATIFLVLGMIISSCTPKPQETMHPRIPKVVARNLLTASEQILICLDRKLNLPAEQLATEFMKAKQSFIVQGSIEKRLQLICLALASQEPPESFQYAQELIDDMQLTETAPHHDMRGLAALLNSFQQLHQKRLAEVDKAQKEVAELKKRLEKLKSIEKIIIERKHGN